MTDALDNILDFIMSDDSPMTQEDYDEVRKVDAVIVVAKTRVAVEAVVERHLEGVRNCIALGQETCPIHVVAQDIEEMRDEISDVMRKGGEVWSADISAAPRGQTILKTVQTSKGERTFEAFEPDWIWAATAGGEVIKSHFVPPTKHHPKGRWLNLHSESVPIAWRPFVKPAHPTPSSPSEMEQTA